MSPKQFVLERRYALAIKLLETEDTSLNAVASMCGYDDYAQFSTFFKKKSNMSPIQYRKSFLNK